AAKALRAQAKRHMTGEGPWSRAQLRRVPREALALALHRLVRAASEAHVECAVQAIRSANVRPRRCSLGSRQLRVEAKWVRLIDATA
ncbi:MAG: hypothetical protein EBR71_11685, partial [Planctomycetes bacterium]|nr:hypothetical protein [Planctomycetota bacterium]